MALFLNAAGDVAERRTVEVLRDVRPPPFDRKADQGVGVGRQGFHLGIALSDSVRVRKGLSGITVGGRGFQSRNSEAWNCRRRRVGIDHQDGGYLMRGKGGTGPESEDGVCHRCRDRCAVLAGGGHRSSSLGGRRDRRDRRGGGGGSERGRRCFTEVPMRCPSRRKRGGWRSRKKRMRSRRRRNAVTEKGEIVIAVVVVIFVRGNFYGSPTGVDKMIPIHPRRGGRREQRTSSSDARRHDTPRRSGGAAKITMKSSTQIEICCGGTDDRNNGKRSTEARGRLVLLEP